MIRIFDGIDNCESIWYVPAGMYKVLPAAAASALFSAVESGVDPLPTAP